MTDASAFAPGQLWRLTAPLDDETRVLVGRVERFGPHLAVHVAVQRAPIPPTFKDDVGQRISLSHLPFTADALAGSVAALEAEGLAIPVPFEDGYAAWANEVAAGRGGVFGQPVNEVLAAVFTAIAAGGSGKIPASGQG